MPFLTNTDSNTGISLYDQDQYFVAIFFLQSWHLASFLFNYMPAVLKPGIQFPLNP